MRKWIIATLVWAALFAAVALVALGQGRPHTHYETFDAVTRQDQAGTTASWDTEAGQLKLHPPAPVWEGVAGQLYHPAAWSPAVYLSSTGRAYLFGGPQSPREIQVYNPADNATLRSSLQLPAALFAPAMIHVPSDDTIHLIGGQSSTDIVVVDVTRQITSVLEDRLPAPLYSASAVYVPQQHRAYIFGGISEDESPLATIWQYDLATGTVVTLPATLPISVSMTSAVYDATSDSAYIFGGRVPGGFASQGIVRFDVTSQTVESGGSLPEAASGSCAALVPEQQKVYLFGGRRQDVYLSQVVQYDIAITTAMTLPVNLPFPLTGAAAAYVPEQSRIYVLGGELFGSAYPDITTFDVTTGDITAFYTRVAGRSEASAVYAPYLQKAYLFGGKVNVYIPEEGGFRYRASQDILVYDAQQMQVQLLGATLPVSRTATAAAYDPAAQRAYVFGGALLGDTTQYFADILRFDLATESWLPAGAGLPRARAGAAAVFDPDSGKAYVFGGIGDSGCLDQILVYDPASDEVTLLAATLPTPAAYMAAAYDAIAGRIYLFGGWSPDVPAQHLDTIVAFDLASQNASLLTARLPYPRAGAAAFFAPGGHTAYIMGGRLGFNFHLRDVVAFDAATGEVNTLTDLELGEGRSDAPVVYVPQRASAYFFGGSGGLGAERPVDSIAMLKLNYSASEQAQSLRVSEAGEDVHEALLTAQQDLNGGYVQYSLSNDGGRTWADVLPGVKHAFASPGADLRWRAVLGGDGETTPVVDSLTITYNGIVGYDVFLPIILRGTQL